MDGAGMLGGKRAAAGDGVCVVQALGLIMHGAWCVVTAVNVSTLRRCSSSKSFLFSSTMRWRSSVWGDGAVMVWWRSDGVMMV